MGADPLLVPGITDAGRDPVVLRGFLTVVHRLLREHSGRLTGELLEPDPGRNHYTQPITLRDATEVALLLQPQVRYVAAVVGQGPRFPGRFHDVPAGHLFEGYGFRVVTADEMERNLTDGLMANLDTSERDQASYWTPQRVGEVVFNIWD